MKRGLGWSTFKKFCQISCKHDPVVEFRHFLRFEKEHSLTRPFSFHQATDWYFLPREKPRLVHIPSFNLKMVKGVEMSSLISCSLQTLRDSSWSYDDGLRPPPEEVIWKLNGRFRDGLVERFLMDWYWLRNSSLWNEMGPTRPNKTFHIFWT